MQKSLTSVLLFLAFTSCTSGTSWSVDSIETGAATFDSSRLCYQNALSPLRFEFIRCNEEILGFLSLVQFRFSEKPEINVQFTIEDETFEDSFPLAAGNMRLRLSPSTIKRLLSSLQEGKKIAILVDGFEQTLVAENFQKSYEKWMGNQSFLITLLKGPIE